MRLPYHPGAQVSRLRPGHPHRNGSHQGICSFLRRRPRPSFVIPPHCHPERSEGPAVAFALCLSFPRGNPLFTLTTDHRLLAFHTHTSHSAGWPTLRFFSISHKCGCPIFPAFGKVGGTNPGAINPPSLPVVLAFALAPLSVIPAGNPLLLLPLPSLLCPPSHRIVILSARGPHGQVHVRGVRERRPCCWPAGPPSVFSPSATNAGAPSFPLLERWEAQIPERSTLRLCPLSLHLPSPLCLSFRTGNPLLPLITDQSPFTLGVNRRQFASFEEYRNRPSTLVVAASDGPSLTKIEFLLG